MKAQDILKTLFCFLVLFTLQARGTITSLNMFRETDYRTCLQGDPDYNISITDDGNCYELIPANPSLNSSAYYYRTRSESFTGGKSAASYTKEYLIILERCDCEFVTNRENQRAYNASCQVARLAGACSRVSNTGKMRKFLPHCYNDSLLAYWGVDANDIQNFYLY